MTSYARKLMAEAENMCRNTNIKPLTPVKRSLQYISLDTQLKQMIRTIPKGEMSRPWHMDEFVTRLAGKYRERPPPRWIGQVLRAQGWTQKRLWSAEWGGRRVWIAPCPINL